MTARLSAAAPAGAAPSAGVAHSGLTFAEFVSRAAGLYATQETAGKPDLTLRVIRDPAGKKLAEKLYETYIRRQDAGYDNFVEFLYNLDRMMSEHGGLPIQAEEPEGARKSGADESEEGDEEEDYDDEGDDDDYELSVAAEALMGCAEV